MRILIVDDDAPVAELLASFCDGTKHSVDICTSPLEAVGRISAQPPDVLVTDIVMEQLDGLSLVREARKIHRHLEAVVITGFASSYTLEEVLQAGASDLILKPIRMQEFRARIEMALERQRTYSALDARQRELQATSTEMIEGLQRELEDAVKRSGPVRSKVVS